MSKKLSTFNNSSSIMMVIIVILAFAVGAMWQKINALQSNKSQTGQQEQAQVGNNAAPSAPKFEVKDLEKVTDEDHIRGNKAAKVALIEYSDFECPFCKSFHPTAKQALDEYGDQLMWVYRHFPLDQLHPKADKEAEAAECAAKLGGEDAFWALTDKIYEVTPSNNGLDLDTLPDLAAEIGLNKTAFQTCLDSGEMAQKVEDQYQSGLRAGVTGTPGNILLNTETGEAIMLPGAVPYAQLKQSIDSMLQ